MIIRKLIAVVLGLTAWAGLLQAETYIVNDGVAHAEIVVAEEAPRRAALAAQDLQYHLKKITEVELPIVHEASGEADVRIYVGRSEFTDSLGLTADDLDYGAFLMQSGPDYLVLMGRDEDYEPNEPWARRRPESEAVQKAWEEKAGGYWLSPMRTNWRRWHQQGGGLGWEHDQGGSYNAVAEFLRSLGVRWYMPGDLGTVIPELTTVELPEVDETIRPDYAVRYWFGPFFAYEDEDVLWEYRLGMNSGYDKLGAGMHVHGMRLLHGHEKMRREHPEYYALIDGKRDTDTHGTGHACFSSEGLKREAVNFARAVFDIYDEPAVSLWPQDGLRHCQCELCKGKSSSDLVWGFIDDVAREVYETHPDRLITGGAYTSYRTPPESIEQFSPNVAVFICNVGRPRFDDDEAWESYWRLVQGWNDKLAPGRLIRNENNRYSGGRPVPFPIIHPRAMARDLSEMRGISLGDWNEQARSNFGQPGKSFWNAPGLDHLTLYVNSRFLWDAGQDVEPLMEEYYELFYGPAAEGMREAFEFAQATYPRDQRPRPGQIDLADRLKFVELLHAARDSAGDTIYGERIDLVLGEVQDVESLRTDAAMADKRGDVPVYSGTLTFGGEKWGDAADTFVLDGKIEEDFWTIWSGGVAGLRVSESDNAPRHTTNFRFRWYRGHLYLGIICRDDMSEPLNISTTEDNDPAIFDGDHVEVMIETPFHSYYRLVVNPAGALFEMDMGAEEGDQMRWASNASVATYQGEDYWSVEMRIPVVGEEEGAMDPYHYVVGRIPSHVRSGAYPWYFNVGRTRVRDDEVEVSAFVPTGDSDLQDPYSFAEMYRRN